MEHHAMCSSLAAFYSNPWIPLWVKILSPVGFVLTFLRDAAESILDFCLRQIVLFTHLRKTRQELRKEMRKPVVVTQQRDQVEALFQAFKKDEGDG